MLILNLNMCLRPFVLASQDSLYFPLNMYLLRTHSVGPSENSLQCSLRNQFSTMWAPGVEPWALAWQQALALGRPPALLFGILQSPFYFR